MGHHLDDQAETFLLRALRGSGPKGLSAIPARRPIGRASILRPLLRVERQALQSYAQKHALAWVEDESNASSDFDRNFLRLNVLPVIAQRWPGYASSWARSAALCADTEALIADMAAQDLALCQGEKDDCLSIAPILALSTVRQKNLLRYWLGGLGFSQISANTLEQTVESLLLAREDASAQLSWEHGDCRIELRRFKGQLILQRSKPPIDTSSQFSWALQQSLSLPDNGVLEFLSCAGSGVRIGPEDSITVAYRQGGERLRLSKRPNKTLKKLLQEANMPPWWRERVPLIYINGELVCVPGIGIAEAWRAGEREASIEFQWHAPSNFDSEF